MAERIVTMTVNGKRRKLLVNPGDTLLTVLRDGCGLTGTHHGCGEGSCGACTVLLDDKAVVACLVLAQTIEGASIQTIEGLGTPEALHPLQQAFMDHFAAQCGACTPGMINAALALLKRNAAPSREEVIEAISGNVCRCTGYAPIVDAIMASLDAAGAVAND
jgi:carbon-monoxide dehydrogenase small subunit